MPFKPYFNIKSSTSGSVGTPSPGTANNSGSSSGSFGQKSFHGSSNNAGSTGAGNPIPGSIGTVGGGIQHPAMQHQFIVRVEGTSQQFTDQTIAFAMNMAKNELLMIVEQSLTATTREHVVIQDIIDNPDRLITLEIMNPNTGLVNDTIQFQDCVIEDHAVDFNYANVGAVAHILIWSYAQIDLGAGKAAAAYASAMSIVGKP